MLWLFSKNRSVDSSKIVLTEEFRSVLSLFENSNNNLFLTGNAGTGKTTLLKQFREQTNKKVVLLAPTGIAALNVGGKTIHSFFHFPPRIITSQVINELCSNNRIYKIVDTIIIDEVSMVRADVFEGIDIFMRRHGRDSNRPFGGAQIILVGDPYQLPPVVTSAEEPVISKIYKTPYFFSAKAYNGGKFRLLELTEIHRQHDAKFIEFLNLIRHGNVNMRTLQPINNRITKDFYSDSKNQGVTLTTTNRVADTINQTELSKLSGPEYEFEANIEGEFPKEKDVIIPRNLSLRKGARVMALKNTGKFNNGDMGIVTKLDGKNISIKLGSTGEEFVVLQDEWENIRYGIDPDSNTITTEVLGKLKQFPLRLAWAITIHKSQGMTFDRVNIDYTRSPFVGGQTYVALSRCRTLEGITITKELYPNDVFVDDRIVNFMNGSQDAKV
ncbi:MAG: AAA family ATPase [Minisyncoccales bacterium]